MNVDIFKNSATSIIMRNISERIVRVIVGFVSTSGELNLTYLTESRPVDDDWDECELSCAELIAEFPEINRAKTDCCYVGDFLQTSSEKIVFNII
jgi:hypothetical protein